MDNEIYTCQVCGKKFTKETGIGMIHYCSDECFHKDFWDNVFSDPNTIICDGIAYTIGDENSASSFRGFGGSKFKFRRISDDSIIETTNLWHRGTVPDEFKENHPDTVVRAD